MPIRTIIVDDSVFIINQLKKHLHEELGHEIVAVGRDGNEAVELFRRHMPDLMTIDLSMPHTRGTVAVQQVMSEFPTARIVVVSAVRGAEMIECIEAGTKGFIEKPLKFDDPEYVKDFELTVREALTSTP